MNADRAVPTAIGVFLVVVIGALLSSLLGGTFGAIVALISPEMVCSLFSISKDVSALRYCFAVGMLWGLFIGAAASGFACVLAVIIKIFKIRLDYRSAKAE